MRWLFSVVFPQVEGEGDGQCEAVNQKTNEKLVPSWASQVEENEVQRWQHLLCSFPRSCHCNSWEESGKRERARVSEWRTSFKMNASRDKVGINWVTRIKEKRERRLKKANDYLQKAVAVSVTHFFVTGDSFKVFLSLLPGGEMICFTTGHTKGASFCRWNDTSRFENKKGSN